MTILQQPDALSFSMNLKPFKISTSEEVEFSLMQGGETLLSEMLSPDADGQIELSLRDIIHDRLSCQVPPTADPYVQSSVVADFTAVIGSTSVTFRVIRGGVDRLSGTVNDFLRANFLTWQPNVKPVTYSSPEFLSYYAVDSGCKLKVKAYFTDSAGNVTPGAVKNICSLTQGVVTTVSVQYAVIAGLYSDSLPAYYDVWVASGSTALTYTQRYYASTMRSEEEQWMFFENSLGGIDTFRTFGAVTLDAEHTHHIAEIDDVSYEYRVDTERKWTVNTGHLDISERRWLLDFFPSAGKYVYAGSAVRRIVLTDDSVSYRFRELPSSYSFTFRFAETLPLLNLPRHELPVEMLDITVPDIGSFTLPPRLLEFSQLPLSEGVLFPVQSPYAEEWQVVTMGGITQYLRSVLDIPSPGLGRTDIIRLLSAQLTPLDPLHPEESRIDPSWLPEGYGAIDIEHVTGLREELDSKLDTRFFSNVFTVYDGSGNAIVPNTYEQVADNLKIMVGAWTDQYLSALGLNSQGGGGETGGVSGIRISSSSVLTPDEEGVVNIAGYIIQPAEKTRWDAAAAMRHAHSNKSILDSITSQQISSWNALTAVRILPGDGLAGGGDLSADVTLSVKLASNSGLSVSSGGLKLDAVNALNSTLTYKALSAAQGKALNDRLAILEAMFTREGSGTSADPYVIRANYGLYTDSFLSALGLNSQGGGGSTFDEDQMWAALRSNTGTYANEKINANHIPDMAGIYGYLKTHQTLYTLSIYGGTTKVLDFKPDANASIYIKAGGDISLANDTTNRYITLSYSHPTDGANTTISAANGRVLSAITVNSLGHVTSVSSKTLAAADIPSLAWDKITSGKPTTLGGYGITDAKIASGVITLGGDTITPVTSVSMTVPTGFSVSGSPISKTGTLALTFADGYEGFTTTLKNKIDLLYSLFTREGAGTAASPYVIRANYGLYTNQFLSSLGQNSQGGSGDFDEEQMWIALGTDVEEKVIASSHIPDTSSIYGYLKASSLNGYATQNWVNSRGFLTSHQNIYALTLKADGTTVTTYTPNSATASLNLVAGTNISLTRGTNAITIANTYSYTLPLAASGTRGGVQIGYSESGKNYAVKLSGEKMYVSVPWTDTTYESKAAASGGTAVSLVTTGEKYTWNAKQEAISDLSTIRSNASNGNTAYGYFTNGVAKTAAKLSTVSMTAWGQTYWTSGGVPTSISGDMTDVGNVTLKNGYFIRALGPDSTARNIIGFSSSGMLYIGNGTISPKYLTRVYGWGIQLRYGYTDTSGNVVSGVGLRIEEETGAVGINKTLAVGGATTLTGLLTANGNIVTGTSDGAYIQIGAIKLVYDSTNNALKVIKSDDTSANLYATGAVSALGANSSGGGGGGGMSLNEVWQSLTNEVADNYSTTKIHTNHIPDMAGIYGYLKSSALSGYVTSVKVGTTAYNPSSGVVSLPAYPTSLPASDVYAWAKASTKPSYTLDEVSDGITRKLANCVTLASAQTINATKTFSAQQAFTVAQGTSPFTVSSNTVISNLNADLLDGHHGSYYATASSVTTISGYFSNGVSNKAAADSNGRSLVTYKEYSNTFPPNDGTLQWYTLISYTNNYYTKSAIVEISTRRATATILINFWYYNSPYITFLGYYGSPSASSGGFTGGVRVIADGNNAKIQFQFYAPSSTTSTYRLLGVKVYSENPANWVLADSLVADTDTYESFLADVKATTKCFSGGGLMPTDNNTYNIGSSSFVYKNVYATTFHGALTGNADSATKLQTERTIWGQSFDGSANVSGAITGATTISASSNVSVGGTLGVTGATTLSSTLSVSGNTTIGGNIYLDNGNSIYSKDANGTDRKLMFLATTNNLYIGSEVVDAGGGTFIIGNDISLRIGGLTSSYNALSIDSSKNTTLAGTLRVNGNKIYFGDTSHYLELNSTGFHFSHGVYSDGFMSALGANSGGGSGDFDEEQMWIALGTDVEEKVIASSHIPDTSSIYGYLKASSLNGYATQNWVNSRGFLTSHQNIYALTLKADGTTVTTYTPNSATASLNLVAGTNISLTRGTNAITIANTYSYTLPLAASGTRGGVQIGYSESGKNYAVKLSGEKMYVSVPWTDTTYESKAAASGGTAVSLVTTGEKYTWNAKQEAISDLSTIRSNASNGNTAYGYFTNGVAKTAAKLSTVSMTAWGQTYWTSGGVPTSISGDMTDVGNVTLKNGYFIRALGPDSTARNIIGFSSSGMLYIGNGTISPKYLTRVYGWGIQLRYGYTDTSGNVVSGVGLRIEEETGAVGINKTLAVGGATTLTGLLTANGNIVTGTSDGAYIQIGAIKLVYDSTNNALKVIKSDDTSANLYATGAVSALGANSSGGGGGGGMSLNEVWQSLTNEVADNYSTTKIHTNHIPDMAGIYGYLKSSALSGYVTSVKVGTTAYNPSSGVVSLPAYPTVPTKVSAFTNDSGYVTSSGVTSVATGTGLTGGTITSTGTVSISSTYRRYISNGNTAYEWGNHANAGYALASSLSSYLPLTGGTITGTINRKMSADTSNYEPAIYFVNVASGTKLAEIGYWNTAQRVYINPIGSSYVYDDAIGKYSLMIGNNSLTYNTYTIYHAGNSNTTSVDWSCQHLTIAGNESSNITTVWNGNGAITTNSPSTNAAIRHAIRFNWYSTSWEIGNIRDSSDGTHGFGITSGNSTLVARFTTSGAVVYGEVTATSDARQKTLLGDTNLSVKQIADAPNIKFLWKDNRDEKTHIGSLAQYWDNVLPEAVTKDGTHGYMSLNYGALALCSAITIARMTINHEDRITMLERENAKLKARIAELEERRVA